MGSAEKTNAETWQQIRRDRHARCDSRGPAALAVGLGDDVHGGVPVAQEGGGSRAVGGDDLKKYY